MKQIIIAACLLFAMGAKAQYIPNSGAYSYKGLQGRKSIQIPTGNGAPTTNIHAPDNTTSALYFDSTNDRLYKFNPKTQTWSYFSASSDTAYLTANYGIIISADDSTYKPNGDNVSISVDTSVIHSFVTLILETDTSASTVTNNADFIVKFHANAPTTDVNGDQYLVGTSPTGAFASHANDVATKVGASYTFVTPDQGDQLIVDNADNDVYESYRFNGTTWDLVNIVVIAGGNRGIGNLAIGTTDKKRVRLMAWNKTAMTVDTNRTVILPRYIGARSNNYLKISDTATGKVDTASFRQLVAGTNITITPSGNTDVISASGGISSVAWGDITGTLSNQTDLQAALDAKQNQLNGTGFVKASGTTITYDNSTYITGNQTITLTGDVSGSGTTAITTTIGNNKVTNAMMRQSAGLSVIGNSTNSTANVADITAGSDKTVLSRNGTSIGFNALDSSYLTQVHSEAYYNTKYQGLLTLTTTGSSGAATLTGNTLNIPQYSGGGGSSVVFDSLKWFNVYNWNIKPANSEATNTTNWATLMAAVVAAGGGKIYIPFADSAIKGKVVVPSIAIGNTITIEIVGGVSPNFFFGTLIDPTYTLKQSGAILQSFDTTGAVITAGSSDFNGINLKVTNLDIRTSHGSKMKGINGGSATQLEVNNCFINTGEVNSRVIMPQTTSTGIVMPHRFNGAYSVIKNTVVSGFYNGIDAGEHTYGEYITAISCWNGLNIETSDHDIQFTNLRLYDNHYNIRGTGAAAILINNLDIERAIFSDSSAWKTTVYDINDSLNLITGMIGFYITVGSPPSGGFKNGAANLNTYSYNNTAFPTLNTNNSYDNNLYQTLNQAGTGQTGIEFKNAGTSRWKILTDFTNDGKGHLSVYDATNNTVRAWFDTSGLVRLGATASSSSGYGLKITSNTSDFFNGLVTIDNSGGNPFVVATTNPYIVLNSTASRQTALLYKQNGSVKFQLGMDANNNGTADFYIYAQGQSTYRGYLTSGGDFRLGGDAFTSATSSAVTLYSNKDSKFNGAKVWADNGFNLLTKNSTSAANASITMVTYTVGSGGDSTFDIKADLEITAVTGGTVLMQVTWTDVAGTSQTKSFFSQGATTAALSVLNDASSFPPMTITAKASTTITVATVVTGTITYSGRASIFKDY